MAVFTLDSIREAAEAKYGSTDIPFAEGKVVRLLNPLRLEKSKRRALMSIQDRLDSDKDEDKDVDQEEVLIDAIHLVADDDQMATDFLAEIGNDLAVLAEVFSIYTKESQAGEASASQE